MYGVNRTTRGVVMFVALAVAIVGYLAGRGHSAAARVQRTHTTLTADAVLTYPTSWKPATDAPQIPALSMTHSFALGPNGDAAQAGLLTGQLTGGQPSPLPARFIGHMRGLPNTEVVDLAETQAYRYSRLSIPGFNPQLTLYVIPNPEGKPTAFACYASQAFSSYLHTCQQIVSSLTLVGQSQGYALTPDPDYARGVNAGIQTLNRQRVAARRQMGQGATSATLARLASGLAHSFTSASISLSTLESSPVTERAHTKLIASLGQARDAYTALSGTVSGPDRSRYDAARARVYEAEASVETALENFTLLGYRQS
jgi:hypothetical protein